MVTGEETARALEGVYRIAVFDRAGVDSFGRDLKSCARSFWAYGMAAPALLLLIGLDFYSVRASSPVLYAAGDLVGTIIAAVGFPLLMLPLLRRYGRADRWAWFVTGYNWFNATQAILIVTVMGVFGGSGFFSFANAVTHIYLYVLEAFLAEAMLDIGPWRAVVIVLVDVGLSFGVDRIAQLIGGVS